VNKVFRLLLTGSRGVDAGTLWVPSVADVPVAWLASGRRPRTLPQLLDGITEVVAGAGFDQLLLVHGACRDGVDAVGAAWARVRRRVTGGRVVDEPHPARWCDGLGAGFARNHAMVRLGADLCLALIAPCRRPGCRRAGSHGSHGVSHCAAAAAGAGIRVQRFDLFSAARVGSLSSSPESLR
jgi:hypothetical protein